jgi:UDP-N-acetylmuramoyl-L-alanyl-D-glutamate--2,6-diaminopimelate ligase
MLLDELIRDLEVEEVTGDPSALEVASVEFDSRAVGRGSLFCCLAGERTDGHEYAGEAVSRGAVALLVERRLALDVPQVVVGQGRARHAMARLACAIFGHPARALRTAAVTGTNGKTTTAHLMASILEAAGLPTSVIGTLGGERTTPEAPVLQALLARARDRGKLASVIEVSSHALVQSRVDGFVHDVAVFTNLSHEHLDFHKDMESYFRAKAMLFTPEHARLGVVDTSSEWGRRLARESSIDVVEVGEGGASEVVSTSEGSTFLWRDRRVRLGLASKLNVRNAVLAAEAALVLGASEDDVVTGLGQAGPLPGRFERVAPGAPVMAFVDFAHTPEALGAAIEEARAMAEGGRVIVVFGCGGDRDRAKRPDMGSVAAEGADLVIVTTDNPRSEDPADIAKEVLAGVPAKARARVGEVLDRRQAIIRAVTLASPGDAVIVAGKGHESYIERAGEKEPFDDRVELAEAVRLRFGESSSGSSAG